MIVYHITPTVNVHFIRLQGLRLDNAESEFWPRIWFCSHAAVVKMARHLAAWKDVPIDELTVLACDVNRLDLNKQGLGNYWTAGPIAAHNIGFQWSVKQFELLMPAKQIAKIK